MRLSRLASSITLLLASCAGLLRAAPVRVGPVEASLVCESSGVVAGQPFDVGLWLKMDAGWHTYGREPGEAGMPTEVTWDLPPGFSAGPLQWPKDSEFATGPIVSRGYEHEVLLITTITSPATAALGSTIPIRARASWLACSDQCMPGSADLALDLPTTATPSAADAAVTALFARTRQAAIDASAPAAAATSLLGLLLPAFIGGLILNLMPCVFPVLGIKIMGFVHQSGADRRKVTMHGLVFAAGVLLSFWLLAGALLALRAGGEHLGWGFQLQSPVFVFALTAFLLVFGLNMSGVFEFGLAATSVGSSLQTKSGYAGSFFTGVLVTVVSTPCAAPFLAPALGAALAMPALQSFVLFTVIATGLALPYLILSLFPNLVKALPRPGAWMETFKQVMAFPLYATVAFLVWVLAGQIDADALFAALLSLVLVALGVWAYGRWGQLGSTPARRRLGAGFAALALAGGLALGLPRSGGGAIAWRAWSPELVEDLRAHGKVVYVDFTARWCATCKMNKLAVFSSDEVARAFAERGVVAVRADWTNRDPAITAALARFGRSAVPFNLVYGPGARDPIVLPEVLTPDAVLGAIDRASSPTVSAFDRR
jgi:thiol:disulfide interchange protein DsbD